MRLLRTFLLIGLSSTFASAARISRRDDPVVRTCGTELDQATIDAAETNFAARTASGSFSITCYETVNVYWHVIRANKTLAGGDLPQSQIEASIKATNSHYAGLGLKLNLTSVDRTTNETWFKFVAPKLPTNTAMKNLLRKGGADTLNIYSVGFQGGPGKGLLGYATMPFSYDENPKDDGVVIQWSTVPGGSNADYNQGKTLTHELGHWLGLYHTFQGDSCSGGGDFIDDTPPELTPTFGCPAKKDTCPGGGPDPIHNYMDYSDDRCMNQFTQGQFARIKEQVKQYRGISL
ncbi:Extracellular metalloprotease 1 [Rhizoctonia solani]|uniref:Extracellular metalloprotease 1 n=1 Tax=Rhizoctonia solani TaxID=456999 RepID=A0A0K6FKE9_9AGAM|nr:Extracellular metalloprotease 1 [Rhizoctonia solani]